MNGLAPKHLMPEESILWDAMQVADWEIEEALKFAPGTHPLDQAGMYVPHRLYEWQRDGIAASCRPHSRAIISTANESGKMQPHDTRIPTPNGWADFGDLKVGDDVFSMTGKPTKVLEIFEHGEKDVYRVNFDNGEVSTLAGAEHLWWYLSKSRRHNRWGTKGKLEVKTTDEIIEMQGMDATPQQRGAIPACEPVQYPEKDYVIPAYTMGALLGDGGMSGGSLMLSTADDEILCRIGDELPDGMDINYSSQHDYRFVDKLGPGNRYTGELRELGLMGTMSDTKFIPEKYLQGSVKQRTELLRGLMDTDGTISRTRCCMTFYTVSDDLKDGVCELVRSLGGKANVTLREKPFYRDKDGEKVICKPCWRVWVKHPGINPFHLKRKADRWYPITISPDRLVCEIEAAGKKRCRCIRVACETSSYLCNDFIVTHNTSVMIPILGLAMMAAFPGCQVYSTSGSDRQVKEQLFEQQLKPMTDRPHFKSAGWKTKTGSELKVTAPNGSTWLGYVCSNDLNAEGFHGYWREDDVTGEKRYCPCIYIVDEAKSVGDGVHEAIRRIDPDFWMTVSTPGKEAGWLFEGIDPETLRASIETSDEPKKEWNCYTDPYGVNPANDYTAEYEDLDRTDMFNYRLMVSWEDCPHLHTEKKKLERQKILKKYGANSAFVRSMLYGQFQRAEDFTSAYTDEDIALMKAAMRGEFKPIGNDVEAGGDISGGNDEQGLMLRIGTDIILQDHHQQDPEPGAVKAAPELDQADYWVKLLNALGIKPWQLTLDGGGLGATVANYMETRCNFNGIKRAQANTGPRFKFEYRDKYTESHFLIKELLSAGVLRLKYDKLLLKQMRSRRIVEMESGFKIKMEAKPAHRAREKSSPDRLDTLVYMFYDFDRSLLDTYVEQKTLLPNEQAATKMEQQAAHSINKGGGAFSKMRPSSFVSDHSGRGSKLRKLRIGR